MPETREDRQALDDLFSMAYEELRRLAASMKHSGGTPLVNNLHPGQ